MKKTIQLTATLSIIAALAGFSIMKVNSITAPIIEKINEQKVQAALDKLFPADEFAPDSVIKTDMTMALQDDSLSFTVITTSKSDTPVGYAFEASADGYSSSIKYLLGVSPRGTIIGIQILSQGETPGLGSRCMEQLSDATLWNVFTKESTVKEPWFQEQFNGLEVSKISKSTENEWHKLDDNKRLELQSSDQVTVITGATITTDAIINSLLTTTEIIEEITAHLETKGTANE